MQTDSTFAFSLSKAGAHDTADLAVRIDALRQELGPDVIIMGHHYQHESVIAHCDIRGDSLELSRKAAEVTARHIVFCGVYFMGESAALMARPGQQVYLPEPNADCVMAKMTPASLLDKVLRTLTATGRKLMPLAYVNSSLDVKAVVGRYGGAVCTSANAPRMLEWALRKGEGVLFVPDKNLGRNTARHLGLSDADMHQLDIRSQGADIDLEAAAYAQLLLWPGQCAIHARFMCEQITELRAMYPGCTVVAHPECAPDVIAAADAAGSTSAIIRYVDELPDGSTVGVATEINLVRRLAAAHAHRGVRLLPLRQSACSHMAAITPAKLCAVLEALRDGRATPITIAPETVTPARATLTRMFEACA